MEKLKPCPFCGELPITESYAIGGSIGFVIACRNRDCRVHPSSFYNSVSDAIAGWNTRYKSHNQLPEVQL